MIAALSAAVAAPLRDRPSCVVAEIDFIADRDRRSPFSVALDLWSRDHDATDIDQPRLQLTGAAR
jgi:hypothetical protein